MRLLKIVFFTSLFLLAHPSLAEADKTSPAANLSQGQLLIQQLDLKKITINDVKKQKSNENSSKAAIGVQYV